MSQMLPPLIVGVQLDIAKLKQQADQLQSQLKQIGGNAKVSAGGLDGMGGAVSRLGGQFRTLAAAAAIGMIAVARYVQGAVKAAEGVRISNARLAQVAKSMDLFGTATEATTLRLQKYADSLELTTGVEAETIKLVQAKLLTFKNIGATATQVGGQFDIATQAALNLAAAGFGSAEQNAVQLGKALQDPIKGITALSRAGVTFTDAEKKKIQTLVESNKMLEAQNLILDALETQVGGVAEATAATSDKIRNAFGQVEDAVGLALMPYLDEFAKWLATPIGQENLKNIANAFAGIVQNVFSMVTWLSNNSWVVKTIAGLAALTKAWIVIFNVTKAIYGAQKAMALLTFAQKGLESAKGWPAIAAAAAAVAAGIGTFVVLDKMIGSISGKVENIKEDAGKITVPILPGTTTTTTTTTTSDTTTTTPKSPAAKQMADMKAYLKATRVAVVQEQQKYAQAVTEAYAANDKALKEAAKLRNDELANLEKENARVVADITKSFTTTLTGIVQDSMNRLRDAFHSVASIDIGQMFADSMGKDNLGSVVTSQMKNGIQSAVTWWGSSTGNSGGVSGLINTLRTRLEASQSLIKSAAALSGAGFSQTFIEQVVAQGGEIGNTMATQILAATPETQKELQQLFTQTETTANSGMDSLAKSIYEKNGLATDALKQLYKSTQDEMAQAYADQQAAYAEQTKQINDTYAKALAEANSTLTASLNAAGNALNTSLDAIEAALTKKLGTMKGKLKPLQAAIGSLRNLLGGSYVAGTPDASMSMMSFSEASGAAAKTLAGNVTNINTTINGTNLTSPQQTAIYTSNAIKYNVPYLVSAAV
jgi:hypothetical protein